MLDPYKLTYFSLIKSFLTISYAILSNKVSLLDIRGGIGGNVQNGNSSIDIVLHSGKCALRQLLVEDCGGSSRSR